MSTPHDAAHGHDPVRQQPDTTRLGFLLWFCVATAVFTVASLYIALWLLNGAEARIPPRAAAPAPLPGTYIAAGHAGILERGLLLERSADQVNGEAQKLRQTKEAELQVGWTDRSTGQAHAPLGQAMDKVISDYSQRK